MPRSMTGFGRAKFEKDGREYQIELNKGFEELVLDI